MKTIKRLFFVATGFLLLFACGKKQEVVNQQSDLIEISGKQLATEAIQFDKMTAKAFENIVKCNGTIVPLPHGSAKVNAPVSGIIKDIYCNSGQFIERNQKILEISGNEIIDLQLDFAEASAVFKRSRNEYERVRSLYIEKVIAEKEFVSAESDYRIANAKYNALKLKIEKIGLLPSKIEEGDFYATYSIKSPINGYITRLNASIGSYIESQTELFEIIDPGMLQVRLSVFPTDITKVRKGQNVRFKSVNSGEILGGTIRSVGVSVDKDTKSIDCYASVSGERLPNPVANEFFESEIITSIDTVNALPTEAILKSETGNAILILEKQANDICEYFEFFFENLKFNIAQ